MNKGVKIAIVVIIVVAIIAGIVILLNNKKDEGKDILQVDSIKDLTELVDKIYDGSKVDVYNVETREIDLSDDTSVKSFTGLENGQDLEYAVVSEPMISSQAYSLVVAKVKSGVNSSKIAEEMSEGVDQRKWICVAADKLYATNSGDIVFLVMTNEEMANGVFDSFKNIAGNTGKVFEKETEEEELPPDMSFPVPE